MLDIDSALDIKQPSAVAWSPDGTSVGFQVTGPRGSDVRLYSLPRKTATTLVENLPPSLDYMKEMPDLRWSRDGTRIVYASGKDYWSVSESGGDPELLIGGGLLGQLVYLSPDQTMVSFIRDGDIWVQAVAGGPARRLTQGERLLAVDPELFSRLHQWPLWSPDSTKIAYLSPTEHSAKVIIVPVAGGEAGPIVPEEDVWGLTHVDWSPDSQMLAVARLRHDFQRKELVVYRGSGEKVRQVWLDADDKWVDHNINPGFRLAWSHDSQRVAFLSNRTGWRHLYVASLDSGRVRQLTRGEYEVHWCGWSPDDSTLLIVSTRGDLQQRLPWTVPSDGGQARRLVTRPGICGSDYMRRSLSGPLTQWSPDGTKVTYPFSGPDEPFGLWYVEPSRPARSTRIHSALPDGMTPDGVAHYEAVSFQSTDGATIPAMLVTSKSLCKDQKHPALIHFYGGWGQLATLGWGIGFKSDMFNYLAAKRYVILIVDPRGSEGYGDAHSKGLYRDAGGRQSDDLAAGARYLAGLDYVDKQGIGLFGHSYGGYLTVQTMLRYPDLFAAGIPMAGVFDWGKGLGPGYGTYIKIRWGVPDEKPNPVAERSVTEERIKALRGALFVVHGTGDFNAPISESHALVSALLKAGKEFEYMVYPSEPHSWVRPETLRDFFLRCERFLDKYLRRRQ